MIGLGWGLARSGFLSPGALHDLNRLTYWVGLPCLLFYRIAEADPQMSAVAGLLAVCMGATLLLIAAAYGVAALVRLPAAARGTLVQGAFRGNLVFIGLPVILYAFPTAAAGGDAAASALLIFGPMVVMYNVLAVLVLVHSGGRQAGLGRSAAYSLLTNPILIACLGGLLCSLGGVELPSVARRTLPAIGQMALPLALICIGGALHTSSIGGSLRSAAVGAALKVVALPAIGWLLARWAGLSPEHARIALILLACPSASATYVLVRQLGGDEALASAIIMLSNLFAVPAIFVVLALTG